MAPVNVPAIHAYRAAHPEAGTRAIGAALGLSHTAVANALRGGRAQGRPRPSPAGPGVPPPTTYPAGRESPRRQADTTLTILAARAGELRAELRQASPADAATLCRDAVAELAGFAEVLARVGEGRPRRAR